MFDVDPMLFSAGRPGRPEAGWIEPKLDGYRIRLIVNPAGDAIVRTRGDRTIRRPWVDRAAVGIPPGTVIDAELIAGCGMCDDFYRITAGLSSGHGLTVAAFDLVMADGQAGWDAPTEQRRARLEAAVAGTPVVAVPRMPGEDLDLLLEVMEQRGGEGVVWKAAGSWYRPGKRSPKWLKQKTSVWAEHVERRAPEERRAGLTTVP